MSCPDGKPEELSPPVERLRQFLHEEYGLHFFGDKLNTLRHKLGKLARQSDCETIEEYARNFSRAPEEIPKLLDAISTNKTYFFRETEHWDYLRKTIIPGWEKKDSIQVWSAACSTGQEPYSAAMLLEEAVQYSSLDVTSDYRVLATDLARSVLSVGVSGKYNEEALEAVRAYQPSFVDRYFKRVGSEGAQVSERLRRRVVFRQYNLRSDHVPFESSMDLLICRNVFIYFDRPVIEHVVESLRRALAPGGYLFIGHTETLNNVDTGELKRVRPAIYRKSS